MSAAALIGVAACSRTGTVAVTLEGNPSSDSLEVIATTVNPAAWLERRRTATPTTPADSLRWYRSLQDSAARLDARFAAGRRDLLLETQALETMDRHSDAYANRYEEFRRRSGEAARWRSVRDSLRQVVKKAGVRLSFPTDSVSEGRAADSVRVEFEREIGPLTRHTLAAGISRDTLELAAGTWWVGATKPRGVPLEFREVALEPRGHAALTFSRP